MAEKLYMAANQEMTRGVSEFSVGATPTQAFEEFQLEHGGYDWSELVFYELTPIEIEVATQLSLKIRVPTSKAKK